MSERIGIIRSPTQQDLSWFLDLERWEQINLTPGYQRNSIWKRSDRLFFLDTIFNNYPCPAIYVQKETKDGKSVYNVVDGKQRLTTVFDFFKNKIAISPGFGDERLNGKKWKDIEKDTELATVFYNYKFTVEILSSLQNDQWSEVFDRLNRNAKTLTPQELRHARYDGWLINKIEDEIDEKEIDKDDRFWQTIGLRSPARTRRMKTEEFVSILLLLILENDFVGFPQTALDELYAKYDKLTDVDDEPEYNDFIFSHDMAEESIQKFNKLKNVLSLIEKEKKLLTRQIIKSKITTHLYSIWGFVLFNKDIDLLKETEKEIVEKIGDVLDEFFNMFEELSKADVTSYQELVQRDEKFNFILSYEKNSTGAATEILQRKARHDALIEFYEKSNLNHRVSDESFGSN